MERKCHTTGTVASDAEPCRHCTGKVTGYPEAEATATRSRAQRLRRDTEPSFELPKRTSIDLWSMVADGKDDFVVMSLGGERDRLALRVVRQRIVAETGQNGRQQFFVRNDEQRFFRNGKLDPLIKLFGERFHFTFDTLPYRADVKRLEGEECLIETSSLGDVLN